MRVIDSGWRIDWRWSTDLNAAFNRVRERAEFRALLHDLEEDIASMVPRYGKTKRIVGLHGGRAVLTPEPDGGTRASFWIPTSG